MLYWMQLLLYIKIVAKTDQNDSHSKTTVQQNLYISLTHNSKFTVQPIGIGTVYTVAIVVTVLINFKVQR